MAYDANNQERIVYKRLDDLDKWWQFRGATH